ncbi:hypothetical protein CEXT_61411 [Caerostris extrusa]|uniref:Uncharacterized protein n=1 Tax=Caerostris extrusa TaxID=172846 RepID=A0AAV4MJL7_CAEEX|nr:hypothetical protein CEXT_61411 [Caerostris extrusa]
MHLGTWTEKEFAREKEGIMACTECGSSKREAVIGRGRKRRNLLPERKEWEKPFKQKDSTNDALPWRRVTWKTFPPRSESNQSSFTATHLVFTFLARS